MCNFGWWGFYRLGVFNCLDSLVVAIFKDWILSAPRGLAQSRQAGRGKLGDTECPNDLIRKATSNAPDATTCP